VKVIFSRKGFDSGAGRAPSPIIDGRPQSLPIPTRRRSDTTYGDLGLADVVEKVTRGRLNGSDLCHFDPMFENSRCAFGQTGTAQTHLANNGVGVGDVFLFFGLFVNGDGKDRHHRIFGYLDVEEVVDFGPEPSRSMQPKGFTQQHPHTIGEWNPNNTLYLGPGVTTTSASSELRLTVPGGPLSQWNIPSWLKQAGLTYHSKPERWLADGTLSAVARGQEFVSDITGNFEAMDWVNEIKTEIDR